MASVTPRTNRDNTITWRVQFRIDGRMSQESFDDEKAAFNFGALVDRVGGTVARRALLLRDQAQSVSLAEFVDQYLDPAKGHLGGVTPGTRHGYRQIADRSFLKMLGAYPIGSITKQDVAAWVAWQEKEKSTRFPDRTVSAKTLRNYHGLLSAIFTAAVEAGICETNPARGTSLTRGRRTGITFLTPDEFATVLHFLPEHSKPLTIFLAGTGMRWGEATALTWADIDTSSPTATARIEKAWQKGPRNSVVLGPPKTYKSLRTIALWPDLIRAMGVRRAGSELVFQGQREESRVWSARFHQTSWAPAIAAAQSEELCKKAGLVAIGKKPRVHDLRHSHASWLIAKGVPLPYIQARLGHENITTTVDLYGHLLPDMQQATVRVLEDVMGPMLGERQLELPVLTGELVS